MSKDKIDGHELVSTLEDQEFFDSEFPREVEEQLEDACDSVEATLEAVTYLQSVTEQIPDSIPSGRVRVVEEEIEDEPEPISLKEKQGSEEDLDEISPTLNNIDRAELFGNHQSLSAEEGDPVEAPESKPIDEVQDLPFEVSMFSTAEEAVPPEESIYQNLVGTSAEEDSQSGRSENSPKMNAPRGFFDRELSMEEIFLDKEIRTSLSTAGIMAKTIPDEYIRNRKLPVTNRTQLNIPIVKRYQHGIYAALVVVLIICTGFPVYQFSLAPMLKRMTKPGEIQINTEGQVNLATNKHSVKDLKNLAERPKFELSSNLVANAAAKALGLNLSAEEVRQPPLQTKDSVQSTPAAQEALIASNADVKPALENLQPRIPEIIAPVVKRIMVSPAEEPLLQTAKLNEPLIPDSMFEGSEEAPVLQKSFTPGWFVQIAAKESSEAADGLTDLLKSRGFNSLTRQAQVKDKLYHRVLIGPYDSRKVAAGALPKITKSSDLAKDAYVRYFKE